MKPQEFLNAARVPETQQLGEFGLWMISRHERPPGIIDRLRVGWSTYTVLSRTTMSTLHLDLGEVVMEDSRRELRRHLPIWLQARGRVLVTGLGLGCVVRGLLANPDVSIIDVIEIDRDIIRAIGPEFAGNPRVDIWEGDALSYPIRAGTRWDVAWHDIWSDEDSGPTSLICLHIELIRRFYSHTTMQGAWMLPRTAKRILKRNGLTYVG